MKNYLCLKLSSHCWEKVTNWSLSGSVRLQKHVTWKKNFNARCDNPRSFSLIRWTFCSRSRSFRDDMIQQRKIDWLMQNSIVDDFPVLSLSLFSREKHWPWGKTNTSLLPIRSLNWLAPSISVHNTEVESYRGDAETVFTFRMKGWSYRRGGKQAKFSRSFSRAFRLTGCSLTRGVH